MFTSLRGRLLASYVVVIALSLALAFVALTLVARPLQERLLRVRLATWAALVAPRIQDALERGWSLAQIGQQLPRRLDRRTVRVLLVDTDGRVLADSADEWRGERLPSLSQRLSSNDRASGSLVGPEGTRWEYIATPAGQVGSRGAAWVVVLAAPAQVTLSVLSDLGEGLLIAGGVAMVCSVLLAALISHSVARPMRRMAAVAQAIAAGDYEQRLDIRRPDEVRLLAESLEEMAHQIKDHQQALRDLVVNISHDLKTPLTSVRGFAQALIEGAVHDEAARQHAAGVIYDEAGRMVRMVEQLSEMARMEAGQLRLDRREIELTDLLNGIAQAMRPQFEAKGVALLTDVDELPHVLADGDRLAEVFTNLLDNALKYTPGGGRVQLKADRQSAEAASAMTVTPRRARLGSQMPHGGDWVAVSVSDTGCGIPAAELARIFERFYRVDKSRADRRGYGLGLAIAKQIVEAHDGLIGVESLEGLGTRFTVLLPVPAAAK